MSCIFLYSCNPNSKISGKNNAPEKKPYPMNDSSLSVKQGNGIDLTAYGNNPVPWTLDMDFDKNFSFKADDGTQTISTAVNAAASDNKNTEIYTTNTATGPMNIMVNNESCKVNDSGNKMTRKVEITLNNIRYTGCGFFLADPRLNNTWLLDFINDERQESEDYPKGFPTLEFNLSKNTISGTDGCNNIRSQIEVMGTRIRFSPFLSTKMACSNTKAEKIFNALLSGKQVDYFFKDNNLVFSLINDSKLVFKKKD